MKVKSHNGFTGQRIGAIDVPAGELTKEALNFIKRHAWCAADEGDSDFNWYAVSNDFWENVEEEIDPAIEVEVKRLIDFLAYNDCWWVRFLPPH